ncbi:hypothetical protein MKW92_041078 [Papaver armeniacum]|nr:hypothetical protein MKW92_041078 [Papaver armeniacum]
MVDRPIGSYISFLYSYYYVSRSNYLFVFLKTKFEDVFPAEATSVEEYLQQVHEMTMVTAIQEAQKDNVRSFNDYMVKVLEDWQKEKWDFLQGLSRFSTLPRASGSVGTVINRPGEMASLLLVQGYLLVPGMLVPSANNKPTLGMKASVYAEVVRILNDARE